MTPAEELRAAAARMRALAEEATPGPWKAFGRFVAYHPEDSHVSTTEQDAAHIASWHPLVALAVADWLDAEADAMVTQNTIAAVAHAGGLAVELSTSTFDQALAVARAYMGGV